MTPHIDKYTQPVEYALNQYTKPSTAQGLSSIFSCHREAYFPPVEIILKLTYNPYSPPLVFFTSLKRKNPVSAWDIMNKKFIS